ncbi:MAG TPA: hypothetical protein VGM97_05855 [Steroidobacteraceae bacterium]|jgi:hypothetical protein
MATREKSNRSLKSPALPDRSILEKRLDTAQGRICNVLSFMAVSMQAAAGLEDAGDIQGALGAAHEILSAAMGDLDCVAMLKAEVQS